jgi:hypothetical protein
VRAACVGGGDVSGGDSAESISHALHQCGGPPPARTRLCPGLSFLISEI